MQVSEYDEADIYHYRVVSTGYRGKPIVDLYQKVKETEKGYWICPAYRWALNDKARTERKGWKFILRNARRKYAYPSLQEAFESFEIRKKWQIAHCERSIMSAREDLARMQKTFDEAFSDQRHRVDSAAKELQAKILQSVNA